MSENVKKSDTSIEKFGKSKFLIILVGGILGVLFLLFGGSSLFSSEAKSSGEVSVASPMEEAERYRISLEERIRLLCESVGGVSDVYVSVSLAGGYTSVYATEEKNGGESYVTLGSGSSASALLISCEPPQIDGIGVVCRGGENPVIRAGLISLLSATFAVSSARIAVVGK